MGPKTGLDGCGKSLPRRDSITRPFGQQRVAIPTELSRIALCLTVQVLPKCQRDVSIRFKVQTLQPICTTLRVFHLLFAGPLTKCKIRKVLRPAISTQLFLFIACLQTAAQVEAATLSFSCSPPNLDLSKVIPWF